MFNSMLFLQEGIQDMASNIAYFKNWKKSYMKANMKNFNCFDLCESGAYSYYPHFSNRIIFPYFQDNCKELLHFLT